MAVPNEWLAFLREQFPESSRIRLREMREDPMPLEAGSEGTLLNIDDQGTFHVKWDNGRELGVVMGQDSFTVLPPKLTTLKLFMPLTAELYTRDEWGDLEDDGEELDGRALRRYEDLITGALVRYSSGIEAERGIMHWYDEEDSVEKKVHSAVFKVESRAGQLWGVAECQVAGTLSPEELSTLKDYISGQASDGWGEGFEQHEIHIDEGEMYVHLWNSYNWSIQTEEEHFGPKYAEGLPELCFSVLRSTGQLICIKRGESGYYPSDWDTGDRKENEKLADYCNEQLGVTQAQREAIENGSMFGWHIPGADPQTHEKEQPQPEIGGITLG